MPRSKEVTFGKRTYQVEQLPMRQNRDWREQLGRPVTEIIGLVQNYDQIEINNAADIAALIAIAKDLLLGSMDTLLDALFAYSPKLSADRERIETEAYDDEAMKALGVVVSLAYPLDQAVTGLIGSPVMLMSTNSPSANGDNGKQKSTAARHRSTTKT